MAVSIQKIISGDPPVNTIQLEQWHVGHAERDHRRIASSPMPSWPRSVVRSWGCVGASRDSVMSAHGRLR